MPEGDTIFRVARALDAALSGRRVERCETARAPVAAEMITGRRVERVESRGKNLLVHLEGELCLHTHLRMTGSWHVHPLDAPWRRPRSQLRVALWTRDSVAVCFNAPQVELVDAFSLRGSRSLRSLGPDLLDAHFDLDAAARRLAGARDLPIGEAILRQSLVAGVGNVYKSEVLFICRVSPFLRVGEVDRETLDLVLSTARELLARNAVTRGPRVTRTSGRARHWVYGRAGRPCFACDTVVRMSRQGDAGRSTYFCPRCQTAT